MRYRLNNDSPTPIKNLPAAALRAALKAGYGGRDLRRDILAGIIVGVVALPLGMALAIAVGAPPQHGLYTVIVGGFIVALLGGSPTQVTGPTAAFIVILAPIYVKFGLAGLLCSGVLGGLILIGMGVARLGKLIQFIPHPVTTGFTAGIAVVIATLQVKDLLGLTLASSPDHYADRVLAMFAARGTASGWELGVGLGTLAILVILPRYTKRVPAPIVALPLAAVAGLAIQKLSPGTELATIASRFQTTIGGEVVHGIPQLPPMPILPWLAEGPNGQPFVLSFGMIRELLPGAFALAMLGAIESLLSAVVADGMAQTRHDPDAELLALGVGNVAVPFFGGIPATGAIARTATNVRSGGKTPIASMVHAVAVLAAVLVMAPIIGYLPMTSLAALLLLVAWNMSEAKHFVHTLKVAPKSDVMVLLTCFGLTVAIDMVVAVSAGILLAALLFMRRMAEVTETTISSDEALLPGVQTPKGVLVYDISGPLFFGAAQRAMAALGVVTADMRAVILRLDHVPAMDATGLVALESSIEQLRRNGCFTIITGLQPQPLGVVTKAHVGDAPGVAIRDDLISAVALAQTKLGASSTKTPRPILQST